MVSFLNTPATGGDQSPGMDTTRTSTAEESEWRDQGAGAHSSHGVELGLGQRVLRGDLLPPLEEPRSECPPVTPTRDDQSARR